jgi:hypothetical protein
VKFLRTLSTRSLAARRRGGALLSWRVRRSRSRRPVDPAGSRGASRSERASRRARRRRSPRHHGPHSLHERAIPERGASRPGRLGARCPAHPVGSGCATTGRGRLELQSNAGDVQVVWKPGRGDGLRRVVEHGLPDRAPAGQRPGAARLPPVSPGSAPFLAQLTKHVNVSSRSTVERRRAARVHGSALAEGAGAACSVRFGSPWDATRGVPSTRGDLRARRDEARAGAQATRISYGPVPLSTVAIAPPRGARSSTSPRHRDARADKSEARPPSFRSGRRARLDRRPQAQRDRVVGHGPHRGALVVYGEGLGRSRCSSARPRAGQVPASSRLSDRSTRRRRGTRARDAARDDPHLGARRRLVRPRRLREAVRGRVRGTQPR